MRPGCRLCSAVQVAALCKHTAYCVAKHAFENRPTLFLASRVLLLEPHRLAASEVVETDLWMYLTDAALHGVVFPKTLVNFAYLPHDIPCLTGESFPLDCVSDLASLGMGTSRKCCSDRGWENTATSTVSEELTRSLIT